VADRDRVRADPLYGPYNPGVALTVGDLLKIPGLPLTAHTGRRGLGHAIRWVHVSELEDPTPFLKGGELLLTVGLGIGSTAARQRTYVRRLIDAGLAGLGVGTGFAFQRVPRALVDEATKRSFTVFEVPYETPFIAITEAVFTRLVAEQYDLLQRSLEAEHTLTRSVLHGEGIAGIVAALARVTGGWSMLLDLHGAPLAATPSSARSNATRLWSEVRSSKPDGARFSLSLSDHGHHVVVQPVAAMGHVDAYLALGKKDPLTQYDRIVSSHALSLLALELSKERAVTEAERRLKGDVLEQLLGGAMSPAEARRTLERLGFDADRPLTVVSLAGEVAPPTLAEDVEATLTPTAGPFLVSARDDHVLAVLQADPDGTSEAVSALRQDVSLRTNGVVRAGVGNPAPVGHLARSAREAGYALQVCLTERRLQAAFTDLGTYQLLLSLQDPDALRTFAASVLGHIDGYDRQHGGHLIPSLRAFLERNARWEAAATDLYVHRHTLRYRMRKIEELTGRDLASARDRMELFLALRARDLLETNA
jgi:PucR family transcriptional regulator, purine catabolism regulatory protein